MNKSLPFTTAFFLASIFATGAGYADTQKCQVHDASATANVTGSMTEDNSYCTITFGASGNKQYPNPEAEQSFLNQFDHDAFGSRGDLALPGAAFDFANTTPADKWTQDDLIKFLPALFFASSEFGEHNYDGVSGKIASALSNMLGSKDVLSAWNDKGFERMNVQKLDGGSAIIGFGCFAMNFDSGLRAAVRLNNSAPCNEAK